MNTKEIKALISLLEDEDKEILSHVEGKILSLGHIIIPQLEAEWENNFNPIVQKRIEDLIHTLQFDTLKHNLAVWKESEQDDLIKGVWLIATYQYPDLSLEKIKKDLEQMYYEAWLNFKPDLHIYDQIKALNYTIFNKLRFHPNTTNFHAPSNSMINIVLETRRANPILLCVVYMLIAQKLKMSVYGVNLPNLFILTHKTTDLQFYINAFNRGIVFSRADIDNYIAQLNLTHSDTFYEPCANVDILRRILRNLVISFEKLGDVQKVEDIKFLITILEDKEDED